MCYVLMYDYPARNSAVAYGYHPFNFIIEPDFYV